MASLTQAGITFGDGTSQSTAATGFPVGTLMLFVQSAAPTGWTKSTAHNDKALRVVSGSVSSGGSVTFSTAMANRAVTIGSTTLSIAQMPSHNHSVSGWNGGEPTSGRFGGTGGTNTSISVSTTNTGGGGSHAHSGSLDMGVQYVDVIICTKN